MATSAQTIDYTWALGFSPDGTRIATAGEDGAARVWDTSTGALIAEYQYVVNNAGQRTEVVTATPAGISAQAA